MLRCVPACGRGPEVVAQELGALGPAFGLTIAEAGEHRDPGDAFGRLHRAQEARCAGEALVERLGDRSCRQRGHGVNVPSTADWPRSTGRWLSWALLTLPWVVGRGAGVQTRRSRLGSELSRSRTR